MCRLAAYLGPPIPLARFLLDPPHSLAHQAWAPRELVYARLNADGFGFGWFDVEGRPAVYTSTLPIWSDANLAGLGRSLVQALWLAEIRSATPGNPVVPANTPPFHDEELVFVHNGYINDFHLQVRPMLERTLSPAVSARIQGNTDSEYLFALLRELLAEDPELAMEDALRALVARVTAWVGPRHALLNLGVSDGKRIYFVRTACNHDSPSLYYTTDDDNFPGAQLVASEALTESAFWQPVPEHHLLVLDPDEPPELLEL